MYHKHPCKKKDKRLLVLFAFGLLVLVFNLTFADSAANSRKYRSWIEIQGQGGLFSVDVADSNHHLFSYEKLHKLLGPDKGSNNTAFFLERGRAYAFFRKPGHLVRPVTISPKLAYFLGGKIAVNNASADDLTLINGIGPVLASKITAYRKSHGSIINSFQLQEINGIGVKTAEKLENSFIYTTENESH